MEFMAKHPHPQIIREKNERKIIILFKFGVWEKQKILGLKTKI